MRRRSRTPASPCATLSSPCVCRSLRCTCRTSSGENRSAAARCWRTSRSAWWRGSVRRAIGWDSRAWSAISDPAMIADPRRARQEALAAALVAEGLDGLLVASPANIRYLTGFSGSAAIVAVTRGDVLLVTDFRYDEQARAEAGAVARIEVESTSVWDRFFQALATLGPLTVVGYEAHVLSVEDAERFVQAGKPWRWKPTKHLVERLRAAKDAGEVAAIRSAAELAGEGLRRTLTQVRAGLCVRAGMSGRDADALARDVIEARGFGEAFGHSLGHGLGLEVHEAPRLSKTNADPLPVGAVVTIEPGVYVAGQGGVRIEDDVHVSAAGPVLLSDGRTELLELV